MKSLFTELIHLVDLHTHETKTNAITLILLQCLQLFS